MKIIETRFDGHRFRSRTEARWAVFFKEAGLRYDYERDGVVLPSGPYLPDFWLPDIGMFLEVKGEEPTGGEMQLCRELSQASGHDVLLAVGPPKYRQQIIWYQAGEEREGRYAFADDRRNNGEFWLTGENSGASIGPVRGPDHGRMPGLYSACLKAYEAAASARFEHGEGG